MAGSEKFTFILDAKDGVTKIVKDIGKEAKKSDADIKKMSSSITAISTGFLAAAQGAKLAFSAIQGVAGVIGKVVDAAVVQEEAINDLTTAMKLNGGFTRAALKDFEDFAAQLQVVTGVGDEASLKALALAKSFGATDQMAKQMVRTAVDLSATFGGDVVTSIEKLGETIQGSVGEYGKYNAELRALTPEALAAGEAVRILGEQFAGAGAAKLDTFAGRMNALKGAFGDLLEQLGMLVTGSNSVKDVLKTIQKQIETTTLGFQKIREFILGDDEVKKKKADTAAIKKEEEERTVAVAREVKKREAIQTKFKEAARAKELIAHRTQQLEKEKIEREAFAKQRAKEEDIAGGIALGLGGLRTGGVAGVGQVVTGALSASMGPLGGAIGGGLEFLAQDKEVVKAQIQAFADAIPMFTETIAENIPVVIEALVEATPRVIDALVRQIPQLVQTLAGSMPSVAVSFTQALVKEAPMAIFSVVKGLADGIVEAIKSAFGFGSDGGLSKIGDIFSDPISAIGGAVGGVADIITSPFKQVAPTFTTQKSLQEPSRQSDTDILLTKIIQMLEAPTEVKTDVQFNQDTLARIILNLNRTGARLTV